MAREGSETAAHTTTNVMRCYSRDMTYRGGGPRETLSSHNVKAVYTLKSEAGSSRVERSAESISATSIDM